MTVKKIPKNASVILIGHSLGGMIAQQFSADKEMKENPLISVLMPVYNGEKYLREAIDSVLAQTYTNFELLLINDGSTDSSKDIILSYSDPRIRYIENEQNLKLIATLNKGIDLAKGDYIARMDADDVCMPNRLLTQLRFMQKHPQIDMCGSWALRINSAGQITGKIKNIHTPGLLSCVTFFTCPFVHPVTFFKSEVLKNNLYSIEALHTEDTELWNRLRQRGYRFANIRKYLLKYRWHSENISGQNDDFVLQQKKKIYKPYLEDFFGREVSEEELDLHFLSFRLFHFGERISQIMVSSLIDEKKWLENFSNQNKSKKWFGQSDIDALLYSRWLVCCLTLKKYSSLFSIKLPWYNPVVLWKTGMLLINK